MLRFGQLSCVRPTPPPQPPLWIFSGKMGWCEAGGGSEREGGESTSISSGCWFVFFKNQPQRGRGREHCDLAYIAIFKTSGPKTKYY